MLIISITHLQWHVVTERICTIFFIDRYIRCYVFCVTELCIEQSFKHCFNFSCVQSHQACPTACFLILLLFLFYNRKPVARVQCRTVTNISLCLSGNSNVKSHFIYLFSNFQIKTLLHPLLTIFFSLNCLLCLMFKGMDERLNIFHHLKTLGNI